MALSESISARWLYPRGSTRQFHARLLRVSLSRFFSHDGSVPVRLICDHVPASQKTGQDGCLCTALRQKQQPTAFNGLCTTAIRIIHPPLLTCRALHLARRMASDLVAIETTLKDLMGRFRAIPHTNAIFFRPNAGGRAAGPSSPLVWQAFQSTDIHKHKCTRAGAGGAINEK